MSLTLSFFILGFEVESLEFGRTVESAATDGNNLAIESLHFVTHVVKHTGDVLKCSKGIWSELDNGIFCIGWWSNLSETGLSTLLDWLDNLDTGLMILSDLIDILELGLDRLDILDTGLD